MIEIGITERGDAAIDTSWENWVAEGKPAILITKDPEKLWHHLCRLGEKRYNMKDWIMNSHDRAEDLGEDDDFPKISPGIPRPNVIIHCTITGYGGGALEPKVPNIGNSLDYYSHIFQNLYGQRTVLRIDPIIPTEYGFQIAANVWHAAMRALEGKHRFLQPRVRISFLDMYPHVQKRFIDAGLPLPYNATHAPLQARLEYLRRFKAVVDGYFAENLGRHDYVPDIEVCGEPGILCTGCVSEKDAEILGIAVDTAVSGKQRKECVCIAAKHELLGSKHRCPNACLYCYWHN